MKKLILFDCDGTLIDSRAMILASLTEAFRAEDLPPPPEAEMLGIVGLSLINAMRRLAPGESPDRQEALAEGYKRAFWHFRDREMHEEPFFPGAREMLDWLHAHEGAVLGIATGKTRKGVDRILDRHGLHGRFATIQTADSAPSKPDPGMILNAMSETGVSPEDTVMIGDASFDLDMANAAFCHAIGVSWGFQPVAALEPSKPRAIINHFNELPSILQSIWEGRFA